MLTGDQWWQQLWLQIIGGAIAGLIVAAVIAALSETFREKIWSPAWRAAWWVVKWPLSIRVRVSTVAREKRRRDAAATELQQATDAAAAELTKAARVQLEASAERSKLETEVAAVKSLAQHQMAEQLRISEGQIELARSSGEQDGHARAMREVAAQRAVPIPLPVWRIRANKGAPGTFTLENVERRADASDVTVSADPGEFSFDSSARWDGPYTGVHVFAGQRMSVTGRMPVRFTVQYRDERDDWHRDAAVLAPPPIAHVSGKVAKIEPDDPLGPLPKHF